MHRIAAWLLLALVLIRPGIALAEDAERVRKCREALQTAIPAPSSGPMVRIATLVPSPAQSPMAETIVSIFAAASPQWYDRFGLEALVRRIDECLYRAGYVTTGVEHFHVGEGGNAEYRLHVGLAADVALVALDRRTTRREPEFVERWLRQSLLPDPKVWFNVNDLEPGLLAVIASGAVGRPVVEVKAEGTRGVSELVVRTDRPTAPTGSIEISNDLPKAIGTTLLRLSASTPAFLPGFDRLSASAARSTGFSHHAVAYEGPLTTGGHRWGIGLVQSRSRFVEDAYSELGIESRTLEAEVKAMFRLSDQRRTFLEGTRGRSEHTSLSLLASLRNNRTRTFLLGEPFSFDPIARNGGIDLLEASVGLESRFEGSDNSAVLYVGGRYGSKGLFARLGDEMGSGHHRILDTAVDVVQLLPVADSQLRFRGRAQWSADDVVPASRFALGGSASLRGIDGGALSGNRGYSASIELTVPAPSLPFADIEAVAFLDHGYIRQLDGVGQRVSTAGPGLRAAAHRYGEFSLYWSHRLAGSDQIRSVGARSTEGLNLSLLVRF